MLVISKKVAIPDSEIEMTAILSQGPGGQNVNKVSTAIHLRFDIKSSSLPEYYKTKLLLIKDRRISKAGVIIIKAQRYRSQEKNREEALKRLQSLIKSVTFKYKKRKLTKPTLASLEKRLESKKKRGQLKTSRKKFFINKDY